jgi:GWxTD domain-containing protein
VTRFLLRIGCIITVGAAVLVSVDQVSTGERSAEQSLRHLLFTHPDSAALYAELASICFQKGTIEGRLAAARNMKQALRRDPGNIEYRMMLAEVYFEGTYWHYGVDELVRVLEIDPANSEARCHLGRAYLDHATEEWQRKWFTRARNELSKVDGQHHAHAEATRHLARCLFDLGKPDSAAALLGDLPEDSLGTDGHLLLGMALCEQHDMDGAEEAFTKALDGMDAETRRRYVSIELMASKNELKQIAAARPDELEGVMLEQWKRRDPNPATSVNERFVEHLARVGFADFHFAVPRLRRIGSETARGEVYIRYGRPLAWHYDPLGSGMFADETVFPQPSYASPDSRLGQGGHGGDYIDPGRDLRSRPFELSKSRWVWRYDGFTLNFEDTFLNGDYQFPFEQDWSAYVYSYLEKKVPEIYESQIKNRMRVVLDALNFIDLLGRPSLKIIYACDTRGIDYVPHFEWPEGDFSIDIAVLDSTYKDVSRAEFSARLRADSSILYQTPYPLIGSYVAHVPAGKAVAAVSLESKARDAAGFARRPIEVRSFSDGLEMSDIEMRFAEQGSPNASHVYRRRGKAYFAFSIYNLLTDGSGTGEAEVSYEIRGEVESRPAYRRFLDLFARGSDTDRPEGLASVWSKYELRSPGSRTDEVIGIDLAPLSVGDYELKITVMDRRSGESVTGRAGFTIASARPGR